MEVVSCMSGAVRSKVGSMSSLFFRPLLVLALLSRVLASNPVCAAEIDFGRDIRPILSDKCFQCHGADEGTRHADLRLDLREAATANRDGSFAIRPGDPEQSLLIKRILSEDEAEKMPPAESNKHLTPEQIALLRRWIESGAEYSEHWSFQPVVMPSVPAKEAAWGNNEIDAFVLAKLNEHGLMPSPEADKAVLIRRVYQDLLGLLPSPAEVDQFINDSSAQAYEQLIDRLLQSPHYGERWGRHWLDQARYADSHGFTIDGARVMWPYRDWVIKSLNEDLPFDQFTIEQLAGDLLPAPTKSQLVATGFHRNTMINQEGGVKPDQYRHEALIDRVNTTGAVWLGLTIGCAQCHTHKFDPVTHQEYYRLYAFFNGAEDENNVGPTVGVYEQELFGLTSQQQAELQELKVLRQKLKEQERQEKELKLASTDLSKWKWSPTQVTDFKTDSNGSFTSLPDGSLLADGTLSENDTYRVTVKVPYSKIGAVRIRTLTHPKLPKTGPGLAKNGNFVLTDAELEINGTVRRFADAIADHAQPGYPAQNAIDTDPRSGWAINVDPAKPKTLGGPVMNAPHSLALILGKEVNIEAETTVTVVLKHQLNENYLIGRFAIDVTDEVPPFSSSAASKEAQSLRKKIRDLESRLPGKGIEQSQMVMRDLKEIPPTYRLDRGDFLQPDKALGALQPGVPKALTGHLETPPEFRNRLDLARWLVSRDNPLTARVTVNRIWMRYFGRGLVETENDFGFQGSVPTHRDLLDWLAGSFMEQGWSMKALHRQIVLSATYRQSSQFRPDVQKVDSRNLLLAQQSRFRVEGEIVRDIALAASGKLTPVIGGPSVFPPQPAGVYSFTQNDKKWVDSQGPDRYRRTIYTTFYRSAPHPLLTTFDSPDFSTVCTQRPRSNTPLQSLTLANDVLFMELAQGLAQRTLDEPAKEADLNDRLIYIFRLCLTRLPTSAELEVLTRYWKQEQGRYMADVASASKLSGSTEPDAAKQADTAAWVSVARVLLNTDEFVCRN